MMSGLGWEVWTLGVTHLEASLLMHPRGETWRWGCLQCLFMWPRVPHSMVHSGLMAVRFLWGASSLQKQVLQAFSGLDLEVVQHHLFCSLLVESDLSPSGTHILLGVMLRNLQRGFSGSLCKQDIMWFSKVLCRTPCPTTPQLDLWHSTTSASFFLLDCWSLLKITRKVSPSGFLGMTTADPSCDRSSSHHPQDENPSLSLDSRPFTSPAPSSFFYTPYLHCVLSTTNAFVFTGSFS